jgi:hypothetical protein
MSAIPSSAPLAAPASARPQLAVPGALITAGRTVALLALAMLVPGEAARISARL